MEKEQIIEEITICILLKISQAVPVGLWEEISPEKLVKLFI